MGFHGTQCLPSHLSSSAVQVHFGAGAHAAHRGVGANTPAVRSGAYKLDFDQVPAQFAEPLSTGNSNALVLPEDRVSADQTDRATTPRQGLRRGSPHRW